MRMDKLSEPTESLIQIIREDEFLSFAQDSSFEFFKVYNFFNRLIERQTEVPRKFYSHLIQAADSLESFLDEHGARENKTWAYFAEYIASIRNLAIACFYIRHLMDRYPFYNVLETEEEKEIFYAKSNQALIFLNHSILNLFQDAVRSGAENGLQISQDSIQSDEFPEIQRNKRLPKNFSDKQEKGEEEGAIDWCQKVKKAAEMIRKGEIFSKNDKEELKEIIPKYINEENARMYANLIHNIQSDFDTYIKNTRTEQAHPQLKNIRGYISLALHLQEVVLWLSHFYERHEDDIRKSTVKTRISKLVDKNCLLKQITNYAFHFSLKYIEKGEWIAQKILTETMKIVSYELPVPQPHGFHARPSTYLSLIAREHGKDVFLIVDDEKYNIKSVMSLLRAGGVIADKGYQTIRFEGDKKTLDDIKILTENNYCEGLKIPPELNYLKNLNNAS